MSDGVLDARELAILDALEGRVPDEIESETPEPSPRETCARDRHIDPRCRRNIIRAGNTGETTRAGAPKRRAKTHLLSQILQTTKVRCVR